MLKIEGLDKLQQKLDNLATKAKELDGEHRVPVSELLTDSFIAQHTSFSSADEMFKASKFTIATQEDFAAIPDEEWDSFIRSVSSFDSWQSMLGAASKGWAKRKLGL